MCAYVCASNRDVTISDTTSIMPKIRMSAATYETSDSSSRKVGVFLQNQPMSSHPPEDLYQMRRHRNHGRHRQMGWLPQH
mmetsp:Transcript_36145/g.57817  ORF Transcript_36145/g.57817 Transcript_36145/m.57817 type:complete len:80 (+) Transcript_36145:37-276(+)